MSHIPSDRDPRIIGIYLLGLGAFGYIIYRIFGQHSQRDAAMEELRQAYARDELTPDEFEQRRNDLGHPK